jgi:glycosyltransferase EpsD
MVRKVLFCATVDYHFAAFHLPYLQWFQQQGWEVHVAANGSMALPYVDQKFTIEIQRSPLRRENRLAYRQLKHLMNEHAYDIVHCHTPMGGVLARMAARHARKQGTRVLYTAHGFHFCKGAPMMNWLLYYPIEKLLSQYTDCLLTINEEDYQLALSRGFKAGRIEHVHGVGVSTDRFRPLSGQEKRDIRVSYGYDPDDVLIIYAAEFNKNKNQRLLIDAFALMKDLVPQARLLLAGEGPLRESCRQRAAELGVEEAVQFLGHRKDLDRLLPICDMAAASSSREGLPVNIMEAMACGLPVIATDNRGHRELVHNERNGWIVQGASAAMEMAGRMKQLALQPELRERLGAAGRQLVLDKYSVARVIAEKQEIYSEYMEEKVEVLWAVP